MTSHKSRWYQDALLWYVLVMLLMIMLNNIPHLGNKYFALPNGHQLPVWQAWAAVALFELFILLLELMRAKVWAWVFTIILALVSLSQWEYYTMYSAANPKWLSLQSIAPAVCFSLITTLPVPLVGARIVERLDKIKHDNLARDEQRRELEELRTTVDELSQRLEESATKLVQSRGAFDEVSTKLDETRARLEEREAALDEARAMLDHGEGGTQRLLDEAMYYLATWSTCPWCHEIFGEPGSVRSHKAGCKDKGPKVPKVDLAPEFKAVLQQWMAEHPEYDARPLKS